MHFHFNFHFNFRRTFIAGILIILPAWITLAVLRLVFGSIDASITPIVLPIIHSIGLSDWVGDYLASLCSIVLLLLVIYGLGLLGSNVLGRQVLKGLERLLLQIPIVHGIYAAIRQFVDTFSAAGNKAFGQVVLIEFPRQGSHTLAFLTNEVRGELLAHLPDHVVVFVPTTPNPTGGYMLFLPRQDVKLLDMSVDDALKLIISGGVLASSLGPAAK